jgi:cation diffusion facilitator family transporter
MNTQAGAIEDEIYRRRVRRVLLITLTLNLIVVAGKLIAGFLADAMSVISDAVHSSVDSLNNIVGLTVIRFSTAAPDERHPYGHGKFETLAAFIIAGFLFVTCYQISLSAIKRLLAPGGSTPEISALTIGVMISTIVSNIIVTLYERREGGRMGSAFLIADSAHTRSDILVSCSVLAGLFLIRSGYPWIDPLISLVVAGVIAWSGYQIFKSTAPILVDAAPVPAQRIAEIVQSIPGVHSAHDIRSRSLGGGMYVEMHLHLTKEFERDHIVSHAITEEIEDRLKTAFGQVTATIHVEPSPESLDGVQSS